MPDAATLLALAERVEREPSSRELDIAVAKAVGWDYSKFGWNTTPALTSSVDAAVTLVPDGADWLVSSTDGAGVFTNGDHDDHEGNCPGRPAAALTAACLRARATGGAS